MIPLPAGWAVRRCEDSLLLVAPDGPLGGAIRYVERVRPLRRAVDCVRAAPVPADFVETGLGAPERLVTAEGEHAAFIVSAGRIGDAPVERSFGFVFGDDFYARIAGVAFASFERMRATVRDLTLADTHELGVRRRRFAYAPPRDWHAVAGLFDATWYPRDYPATRASITVCPAVPARDGLCPALLDAVIGGRPLAEAQVGPAELVRTATGLSGALWRLRRAADVETHVALLEDTSYVYSLHLDAAPDVGQERFREVLASVEPVPATRTHATVSAAMGHWSE